MLPLSPDSFLYSSCFREMSYLESIPAPRVVDLVAFICSKFVSKNDSPDLKLYLLKFLHFAPCSPAVFVCALIYLDRLSQSFSVCSKNVHHIMAICIMVATKYSSDIFYSNAHYALISCVHLADFNRLEIEFLIMTKFDLSISETEFSLYTEQLIRFDNFLK